MLYASVTARPGQGSGYSVVIYVGDEDAIELSQFPRTEIPCDSYEHARAFANAYNFRP